MRHSIPRRAILARICLLMAVAAVAFHVGVASAAGTVATLTLSDVSVFVTDVTGHIFKRAKLDRYGYCQFTDIPVGTYRLLVVGGGAPGTKSQTPAAEKHAPLTVAVTFAGSHAKSYTLPRVMEARRINGGGGALDLRGYAYKNLIPIAFKNSHDIAMISIHNPK